MPPITLYFLQASRSIRIAWLLEELGLQYDIKTANRLPNMKAPEDFKVSSGNPLGKFPTLKDGEHVLYESGVITEYTPPSHSPSGEANHMSCEDISANNTTRRID